MTDARPGGNPEFGLCTACRFAREVRSAKDRIYILCEQSLTDPRFAKYPAIPVEHCEGYQQSTLSGT